MISRECSLSNFISICDASRKEALGDSLDPAGKWDTLNRRAVEDYINITLCGETPPTETETPEGIQRTEGIQYEVKFTTRHDAQVFAHRDIRITKDVDSALIFSSRWTYKGDYEIFETYDERFAMSDELHCRVRFMHPDGPTLPFVDRDPTKDVAILYGRMGRDRIHLMLPAAAHVPLPVIHAGVHDANYQAMKEHLKDMVHSWCPDYVSAIARARKFTTFRQRTESTMTIRGGADFDSVFDPPNDGVRFGQSALDRIRSTEWGRGAYIFVQVRGSKHLTRHTGGHANTEDWIEQLLRFYDVFSCTIYLDMGVQLELPDGYSCLADRNMLEALAAAAFNIQVDDLAATTLQPDVWAGVQRAGGFRADFADAPITEGTLTYLQVYSTDKHATYNVAGPVRMYPQVAFNMKGPDDIPASLPLIYQALLSNLSNKTPATIRLEARVLRSHGARIYKTGLGPAAFRGLIHVVKTDAVWAWRIHRITGCILLMRYMASCRKDTRANPGSLVLLAATTFLFNAMHSRPHEISWNTELAGRIFPTATLHDSHLNFDLMLWAPTSEQQPVPIMERGALWFPPLNFPRATLSDVCRFEILGELFLVDEPDFFTRLFNTPYDNLVAKYSNPIYRDGGTRRPRRNVKPSVPIAPQNVILPPGVRNVRLPEVRDWIDQTADLPEILHHAPPDPTVPLPTDVGQLVLSVLSEVMQRLGIGADKNGRHPYCRLSPDQRQRVTVKTFQDTDLSTYFDAFLPLTSTRSWNNNCDLLFPTLTANPGYASKQGWAMCPSWHQYMKIRHHYIVIGSPREFNIFRSSCVAIFQKLRWFPQVTSDKLHVYATPKEPRLIWKGQKEGLPKPNYGVKVLLNPTTMNIRDITSVLDAQPILDDSVTPADADDAHLRQLQRAHQTSQHSVHDGLPPRLEEEEDGEDDMRSLDGHPNLYRSERPPIIYEPSEEQRQWLEARVASRVSAFYVDPENPTVPWKTKEWKVLLDKERQIHRAVVDAHEMLVE